MQSSLDAARPDVKRPCGKGLFIAFEGLDGSGKSTQIQRLSARLRERGIRVHCTAEPTSAATGGLIRDALAGDYHRTPAEMAALFLADRISHNVNPHYGIRKLLDEGAVVITDRYYYSSFAYQGMAVDLDWVMAMNLNCPVIQRPDICIYLDVDTESCRERVNCGRTHLEIFEKDAAVMQKIRGQFLEVFERLKDSERIERIDANRPADAVAQAVFDAVAPLL